MTEPSVAGRMPERCPVEETLRQWQALSGAELVTLLMNAVPGEVVVLNASHQIAFANRAFVRRVGTPERATDLAGQRVGDALACIHAIVSEDGCGTMSVCSQCGVVRATASSLAGRADVQDVRLSLQRGEGLDLQVSTTPFCLGSEAFTLFCVVDKGSDRRRRVLERIFFHDVLNTAGGLYGMADLLCESLPESERAGRFARTIFTLSASMIEEIEAQKDLVAAENHDLLVQSQPLDSRALLEEVAQAYRHHEVARGKHIHVDPQAESVSLVVDRTILRRVLGNMLKNALEASKAGDRATLRCTALDDSVLFEVHNSGSMPRDVQTQVFKRSFSTKGADRGLGTYSIKLLTETYLQGSVSFVSDAGEGTTFQVCVPRAAGP